MSRILQLLRLVPKKVHEQAMQDNNDNRRKALEELATKAEQEKIELLGLNHPENWYNTEFQTANTTYEISEHGQVIVTRFGEQPRLLFPTGGIPSVICGFKEPIDFTRYSPHDLIKLRAIEQNLTPIKPGVYLYISARTRPEQKPNSLAGYFTPRTYIESTSPVKSIRSISPEPVIRFPIPKRRPVID